MCLTPASRCLYVRAAVQMRGHITHGRHAVRLALQRGAFRSRSLAIHQRGPGREKVLLECGARWMEMPETTTSTLYAGEQNEHACPFPSGGECRLRTSIVVRTTIFYPHFQCLCLKSAPRPGRAFAPRGARADRLVVRAEGAPTMPPNLDTRTRSCGGCAFHVEPAGVRVCDARTPYYVDEAVAPHPLPVHE